MLTPIIKLLFGINLVLFNTLLFEFPRYVIYLNCMSRVNKSFSSDIIFVSMQLSHTWMMLLILYSNAYPHNLPFLPKFTCEAKLTCKSCNYLNVSYFTSQPFYAHRVNKNSMILNIILTAVYQYSMRLYSVIYLHISLITIIELIMSFILLLTSHPNWRKRSRKISLIQIVL